MRVLHCIPSLQGGGAERQLTYLAGALATMGWDVHVAVASGGPNLVRLADTGATTHQLDSRHNYDPALVTQLARIIRRIRPDLVQVWLLQMEVAAGLAAIGTGIPWILSERSSELAYPPTWKNRLRTLMASRASAIVSNSIEGDRYWQSRSSRAVRRYVIRNAVPLDEIAAIPPASEEETGVAPGTPMILCAGRLASEKNLDTLIPALVLLLQRMDARVFIFGEGPLRSRVERRVADARIADRVRVAGYVSNLWAWMKRATVMVSLALFEGSPNTVLEAMACGCPLVVSDIPAHRELLGDDAALFVNAHSPEEAADAIERVLRHDETIDRKVRQAAVRIQRHALPVIGSQYAAVYQEVTDPRAG